MSVISARIPDMEVSMSEQSATIAPVPGLTPNEVSRWRTCMSKEDAIQKRLAPISENVRNRILMSQELSIYSNSDYVYAIFPIAVDFVLA